MRFRSLAAIAAAAALTLAACGDDDESSSESVGTEAAGDETTEAGRRDHGRCRDHGCC